MYSYCYLVIMTVLLKSEPLLVDRMHVRNVFRTAPDFKELGELYPDLQSHLIQVWDAPQRELVWDAPQRELVWDVPQRELVWDAPQRELVWNFKIELSKFDQISIETFIMQQKNCECLQLIQLHKPGLQATRGVN